MIKKLFFTFPLLLILCSSFFSLSLASPRQEKILNIYSWVGMIDPRIIKKFEEETGIKVKVDFYDSDEILEAKLLTGNSGYDLAIPSISPYFGRQVQMGNKVFIPLDKSKLKNWKNLDPTLLTMVAVLDPKNQYGIPYNWGTTGFGYNVQKMQKLFPNNEAPLDSVAMILDKRYIKKLSECGVTLLDSPQDLFESVLYFQNILPNYKDRRQISIAVKALKEIRPYVRSFTSNMGRMVSDLANGEACFVHTWSGEALKAQQEAKDARKPFTINYVVPKEYSGIWCNLLVIPNNAPHVDNAHKFLDFLMRADIAADNIKYTLFPIANSAALPLLSPELRNNPAIYPDPAIFKDFKVAEILPLRYERELTRAWTNIKVNNQR